MLDLYFDVVYNENCRLHGMQVERGCNRMNLDKLKGKLVEKKRTYDDCSNFLGIAIATFNNKMNGKSKFYVEEVNKLSEFLELTQSEKVDIFLG